MTACSNQRTTKQQSSPDSAAVGSNTFVESNHEEGQEFDETSNGMLLKCKKSNWVLGSIRKEIQQYGDIELRNNNHPRIVSRGNIMTQ